MKAALTMGAGGLEVLRVGEIDAPEPKEKEILVKVMAAGLNRADLLQRQGHYPPPPGVPKDILGMEFAGEIAGAGPGASRWKSGQRVFGIVGGGAQAQYLTTHEDAMAEVPAGMSWGVAAAVPEVYITAHDAMWKQAGLQASETVLIHSVGSAVGIAAVQLARAKGAVPFGTSRTPEKLDQARSEGMEEGVVIRDDFGPLKALAESHTRGGFHVVLDLVGGKYVAGTLPAMAFKGRMMMVGTVAGGHAELNLGMVLFKRLTLKGTVLRSRSLEEKIAITRAFTEDVIPLLATGKIKPVIDSEFPLADIAAAHQRLESNATFGKVVLLIPH